MMESAVAIRHYTVKEIKPLLAVQQRRQFLPQTVPAYAAHTYVKTLQVNYPEYSYKEATLNPTNPANRATEWETDIVSYFRNHDASKELVGERNTTTGPALYLGHPIKITNPACLACHSTPAQAPETLLNTYGNANGFGWKLDEVVGAQVVSVPMSVPLQRADETFKVFMGSLVAVFVLLGVLLNIMLHFIVIEPLKNVSAKADDVSMGNLNIDELKVKGNDEVASIGRSFNRMHRSLNNALKMLDEDD
jgi:protein-histidine pros-kinase